MKGRGTDDYPGRLTIKGVDGVFAAKVSRV